MAKNRGSYFIPSSTQISELRDLAARGNGFFHISASEISSIIPPALAEKWDSAAVIVSGSTSSNGAMAIIGHRVDQKTAMLDQDPFLIRVSQTMPYGTAALIHHASFSNRSLPLPSNLYRSSTAGYFKEHPPCGLSSGTTDQLPTFLQEAFRLAHRALGSMAST